VLQRQLEVFDQVNAKKSAENPMWKEITESQRAYAERTVRWDLDTNVGRRMAYNCTSARSRPPRRPDGERNRKVHIRRPGWCFF